MNSLSNKKDIIIPHLNNAGLNFFVGSIVSLGLGLQIVLVGTGDLAIQNTLYISLILFSSTIVATIYPHIIFKHTFFDIRIGFFLRFLTSALLAFTLTYLINDFSYFMLYLLGIFLFLASLFHKVYFNIGWLYIMRQVAPINNKDLYVAGVRRVNIIVSATLSSLLILITYYYDIVIAMFFVLFFIILYPLWSLINITFILSKSTYLKSKNAIENDYKSYINIEIISHLFNKSNYRWVLHIFTSNLISLPIITIILITKEKYLAEFVVGSILVGSIFSAFILPWFMNKYKSICTENINYFLLISGLFNVFFLISLIFFRYSNLGIFFVLFFLSVLGMAVSQILTIRSHNIVIFESENVEAKSSLFPFYNFVLDIVPLISIFIFSSITFFFGETYLIAYFYFYIFSLSISLILMYRNYNFNIK